MKWKTEKSEYLVNDQWLKLRADRCVMPNGTVLDPYYVIEHCDWINVVAVTPDQRVVTVKQYRHGLGEVVTELPAGCVDTEDSSPEHTARRELLEETGYAADEFIFLASMPLNTSNHNNKTYCYLAQNAERVQEPTPDPTEQLEISTKSFDDIHQLIGSGKLQALHTASFLLAENYIKQAGYVY